MTDLQSLHDAPPSISPETGMQYFFEIMFQYRDWRCYSSAEFADTEYWARRFVIAHARVPSLYPDTDAVAFVPMETFRFRNQRPEASFAQAMLPMLTPTQAEQVAAQLVGISAHGAFYKNGALVWMASATVPEHLLLFVDDATAYTWNYPDDGFIYSAQLMNPSGSVAE